MRQQATARSLRFSKRSLLEKLTQVGLRIYDKANRRKPMPANAFCEQCGSMIYENDRFCASCGTAIVPVKQAPAPQWQPPVDRAPAPVFQTSEERVMGIIPQVASVKGFLGLNTKFMLLAVTSRRLIFVNQTDIIEAASDAEEEIMEAQYNIQGGSWRAFIASYNFGSPAWQCYLTLAPDQILAEDACNFEIPIPDIASIGIILREDPEDPSTHMSDLIIQTCSGEKRAYDLTWGNGDEAHSLLSRVMPEVSLTVETLE
jgi:hypothetical protein